MIANHYIQSLNKSGRKTYLEKDDLWVDYVEMKSAIRIPCFNLNRPAKEEIDNVFKALKPFILSYAEKTSQENANGYLYATYNTNYDIENLDKNGRRDARRALRSFHFEFISWDELLNRGYKAYHDTRYRNNLSDHTQENFHRLIEQSRKLEANCCLVAIDNETNVIGGYLIMTMVDDWIEVTGAFSDNDHLQNCPNNGLFHYLQETYLKTKKVFVISYGYSSIQKGSSIDGLHHFKQRIGFETIPIKRIFIIKPQLKILINPLTTLAVRTLLKFVPQSRPLNKIDGIIQQLNS